MTSRWLWMAVLAMAAIVRLLTLSTYPLHDTTEARYAEIARLMVVSGDWITPQIEAGVPFWGKPPLSTWLTAGSFEIFGFSEFAARLPSFLLSLLTAFIVFRAGKKIFSEQAAIIACVVLLTSGIGFIAAGAVMTDAALMLATTLSLAAICMVIDGSVAAWRYVFFVGLGVGLLAKGPVALVLIGLPTFAWSLWQRGITWLWRSLPWISGSTLMLAIAVPWYWLAEIKSPGFLEYFLVGEHWLRFVESGWQGDLYGSAHARPRGTIWVYGVAAALPWSAVALYALIAIVKKWSTSQPIRPLKSYLFFWMVTPLVFFTFAGNILPAYVLPGLPAFALLLGDWMSKRNRLFAVTGILAPGLIFIALVTGDVTKVAYKSQRGLIEYQLEELPSSDLYYFRKLPYSARFYSFGAAKLLPSKLSLRDFMASDNEGLIAVREKYAYEIPDQMAGCLLAVKKIGDYSLLEKRSRCDGEGQVSCKFCMSLQSKRY